MPQPLPDENRLLNRPQVHYLTISENHENQRIDNYLANYLKGVPKTRIYRILRKGEVRVNKKRIAPNYRLQIGDELRIPPVRVAPSTTTPLPSPQLKKRLLTRIIKEDEKLLIINKPSGLAVHGGTGLKGGLIESLRQIFNEEKEGEEGSYLELVHRLDRETSGCLIIAKKGPVLRQLHQLLRENRIEKIYYALVKGVWPKEMQRVSMPLKKNTLLAGERMVHVSPEGKEAVTLFEPINYFSSPTLPSMTLLKVKLLTGRTHQIRVHAAANGHPIAGDQKYGDRDFNRMMKKMGLKRLFLHAAELRFELPNLHSELNKVYSVKSNLDDDLSSILEKLRE